jgi:hypothetical protein
MSRSIVVSGFDALVSDDLAACVREWDASVQVHVFTNHDDALRVAGTIQCLFAMIARERPDFVGENVVGAKFAGVLSERRASLLLVGDASVQPKHLEPMLCIQIDEPFTSLTVQEALEAARIRRAPGADHDVSCSSPLSPP